VTTPTYIDTLATCIQTACDQYYNHTPGIPAVSDAVFDAWVDELRKLDPTNPVLAAIGAPAPTTGGFTKVRHTIPMGSLNKANTIADMVDWLTGCKTANGYVVSDKCDGGSLGLCYENRKLVQALTRGDGDTGEDVTRNAVLVQGVVKMLPPTMKGKPTPAKVFVRGEVIVTLTDFARHFPGESNPRNTANGTIKRQSDPAKCANLTFLAYQCLPNGVSMASKDEEFDTLKDMGFTMPRWAKVADMAAVEALYQGYIATTRKSLNYWIDGLVIDIDDTATRENLGDLNGRPRGSVAWKFPHEEKQSVIRDILWQVGKSGRITPVAVFDEVNLGGAKVTRASLAGVRQVEYLKLFPGCKVLVSKRNDVIPRLEANLDEGIINDL
jgi:DNA ligase (NAD+)